MIKEAKLDSKEVQLLTKHFKEYKYTFDPYGKVLEYDNGQIIGIISYSIIYERAEINYIATDHKYRAQGIGSQLLEKALEDIKRNNCNIVSLEVEENNIPAINLYSKYGFEKKAIRKNYYGNNNGYLMTKEIR